MMRWCLLCCLFACASAASAAQTLATEAAWPKEVEGFGRSPLDAKNDALSHLTEQVAIVMRQHEPPLLAWRPTPDYVRREVVQDQGRLGPDFVTDGVGPSKTWIFPVKALNWTALTALDEEARRGARSGQRILVAAQVFGGLVVLLGAIRIYSWLARR